MTLLTLQTQRGEVMWFAIFCGDSEAGGTAGGCELMLLTLGNGEQTWTQEGCMVGGRGESKKKKKGTSEEKDGSSSSTLEVVNMMEACVSV